MERDQTELQNLGFWGILRQSSKLLFQWRKIFSQISIALILPLSVLYLFQLQISDAISPRHRNAPYWIFSIAYIALLLFLTLIATAAVIFTVASVFARRPINFSASLRSVPGAWKRLAVTFLWEIIAIVAISFVAGIILGLLIHFLSSSPIGIAVIVVVSIVILAGIVYLTAVFQIAAVVSVLEPSFGLAAVKRGFGLVRGKVFVSCALVFVIGVLYGGVEYMFVAVVYTGFGGGGLAVKIAVGIASCVLLTAVILIGLVVGTVLYFVCKSYHHASIDLAGLSDRLQGYIGNYVVLDKSGNNDNNGVQMSSNVFSV